MDKSYRIENDTPKDFTMDGKHWFGDEATVSRAGDDGSNPVYVVQKDNRVIAFGMSVDGRPHWWRIAGESADG